MTCCKGRPLTLGNATLWKIRLDNGGLVWAADRGANSQCLELVGSAIYEGGIYNATTLALSRWDDGGSGGDRQWNFAKGTASIQSVQHSLADSSIWISQSDTTGVRINSSGSELSSGTVAGVNRGLARITSGAMNYIDVTNGDVDQYDTSFSSLASLNHLTILPLTFFPNPDGNDGFFSAISATQFRQHTSALATADTFTHGLTSPVLRGINSSFAVVSVIPDLKVYSFSPITLKHTISLSGGTGIIGGNGAAVFDESNNFYILWDESTTRHVSSFNSSGAQRWDRTIVGGGGYLVYDSGNLFIGSGTNIQIDTTQPFALASLDPSNGNLRWGASYCRTAGTDTIKVSGSFVYCCGARVPSLT